IYRHCENLHYITTCTHSFFLSSCNADPPYLHSFPTRRSSDLVVVIPTFFGQRQTGLEHHVYVVEDASNLQFDGQAVERLADAKEDRKSTRLNSSHVKISYAVFCLKKKT